MAVTGAGGRVRGLLSYVHPTFMLPAVGTSLVGGMLAPSFDALPAVVHVVSVASALYVAHLVDGYVDGHVRGEETPTLSAATIRLATVTATVAFVGLLATLWLVAGPAAVLATAPLWILGVAHAPLLDTNPMTGTLDYPIGIGLVVVGGHLAQSAGVSTLLLAVVAPTVVLLVGIGIGIDRLDYAADRSREKLTVPVAVGVDRAKVLATGCHAVAAGLVVLVVATGALPPAALVAAMPALLAGGVGWVASPRRTVRLQIGLAYPFVGVLFVAGCRVGDCALAAVDWLGLAA